MTEEELKAIRARVEAASPGPWSIDLEDPTPCALHTCSDGTAYACGPRVGGVKQANQDLIFITSARTDTLALLEEVEQLKKDLKVVKEKRRKERRELAYYKRETEVMRSFAKRLAGQRDEAHAEIEVLRKRYADPYVGD